MFRESQPRVIKERVIASTDLLRGYDEDMESRAKSGNARPRPNVRLRGGGRIGADAREQPTRRIGPARRARWAPVSHRLVRASSRPTRSAIARRRS